MIGRSQTWFSLIAERRENTDMKWMGDPFTLLGTAPANKNGGHGPMALRNMVVMIHNIRR